MRTQKESPPVRAGGVATPWADDAAGVNTSDDNPNADKCQGAIVKLKNPDNYFIQMDVDFATAHGVNAALLAGKLLRLLDKWAGRQDDNGAKWIRISWDEWEKELPFLSRSTIRRTVEQLLEAGIIECRQFSGRCNWYRLADAATETSQPAENAIVQNEQSAENAIVQNEQSNCSNWTASNNPYPRETTQQLQPRAGECAYMRTREEEVVDALVEGYTDVIAVTIPQMIRDDFLALSPALRVEWVRQAFKRAADNNARKWSYVKTILDDCVRAGRWVDKPNFKRQGVNNAKRNFAGGPAQANSSSKSGFSYKVPGTWHQTKTAQRARAAAAAAGVDVNSGGNGDRALS